MTTTDTVTRKHILVVNDEPAILRLFAELFGEEGYRVTLEDFSRQTQDVFESIREQFPDLVILDLIIGDEGGGWQLLQLMKMDRTTRDTPLIVCTGAVNQVNELRGQLETMGVQVVLKPFDIDHLLSVITSML